MKRYAVFGFEGYYPSGGWNDFLESFDTVEEALKRAKESFYSNVQVVDLLTGEQHY